MNAIHSRDTTGHTRAQRGRRLPGLRAKREWAPWTQAELARRAGVGRVTIARLETGQAAARPHTTRKLAKALRCSPVDLFGATGMDGATGVE